MVCSSCKTLYNVQSHSHQCHNLGAGSTFFGGGVVWGLVDIRGGGGVVQEIESSDFKKGTVYQSRPKEKPTSRCQLNPK